MTPTEGITASLLFDMYAAVPQPKRQRSVWVMSKETLDWIKGLPEAERSGPISGDPPQVLGKPVEIQPGAQGVAFIERPPVPKSGDGVSAWTTVFTLYDNQPDKGTVHVGAELTDGTYVSGTLLSFDNDTPPTADRELVLVAPIELRTAAGERHPLGCQFTVLSARRIVRLDVTHIKGDEAA